jgi:aminomuconate-semialdehyde/2-hydroxymuconate-6-semialdehyde dehydrogenase
MEKLFNYIGGNLCPPFSQNYIDNINPSTGNVYSLLPDSDERDVELAVESAKIAFEGWSNAPAEFRMKVLMKIAALIELRMDDFAKAESLDNGKPISLALSIDIPRAISNLEFFATASMHFASESHLVPSEAINYTTRKPIGIVGCISPWNLPLYLFTWKIAPALAIGNCVIAKPSEVTPYTAFMLSQICIDAGLPAGVLNIVHGYGKKVGSSIVSHPSIKAISFTGGTTTGAEIAKVAAPMFKKLSLELGGKNPNIIFADCNFEEMLNTTLRSSFSNQGQICLCGSRIFIEKPLYEKFKIAFIEKVKKMKVGDPASPETKTGAIVSEGHMHKILDCIKNAVLEGGNLIAGGNRVFLEGDLKNGFYIEPTVIEGLPFNCKTNQEEIFGPVVTIMPFDNEAEVIAYSNSTNYGLAATIWTQDLNRAHRVADKLETGIAWINCWLVRDLRTPFGGVKSSGVGREGGWEALRFFTEPKNICIKLQN